MDKGAPSVASCSYHLDRSVHHRTLLAGLTTGCQFSLPDDELVTHDGGLRCIFHLPEQAKARWTSQQREHFREALLSVISEAQENSSLLDLSGVVFPGLIEIGCSENPVSLPRVLFIGCIFTADARIENVVFKDEVYFNGAIFRDQALLSGNTFRRDAHFNDADLGPNIHLSGSRFEANAYFQAARFPSNVWCSKMILAGRGWFQNARFEGIAYLDDCRFGGELDFSADTADDKKTDLPDLTFERSVFADRASFTNRIFSRPTSFASAVFHVAPEFHGCKLHQDTDFSGTRFLDTGKAERSVICDIHPTPVDAARAYRTLKHAMESVRNLDEEMRFFALEQASLRQSPHRSASVTLVSLLYDVTCGYGRNIHRPLILLIVTFAIGAVAQYLLMRGRPDAPNGVGQVLRFTLIQVFEPTALLKRADAPLGAAMLSIALAALCVTLLSLSLIAIRRRFKLG
jgi:uncharacterized protein YjbI with pentapeptide repeats